MTKLAVALLLCVALFASVSADSETDTDMPKGAQRAPEGASTPKLKRQNAMRNLNAPAPKLQRQNAMRNLNAPTPKLQRQNAVRNLNAPAPKNYKATSREGAVSRSGSTAVSKNGYQGTGQLSAKVKAGARAYKHNGMAGVEASAQAKAQASGQVLNANQNGVGAKASAKTKAEAYARGQANKRGVGFALGAGADARAGAEVQAINGGNKVARAGADAVARTSADAEAMFSKDRVALGAHLGAEAGVEGNFRVGGKKNYFKGTGAFTTGVGGGAGFSLQRSNSGKHFVAKADVGVEAMAGGSVGVEVGAPIPKFMRTQSTNDGTRARRIARDKAAMGETVGDLDSATDSLLSSDFE